MANSPSPADSLRQPAQKRRLSISQEPCSNTAISTRGGSRTHTPLRTQDFESSASAIPPLWLSGESRGPKVSVTTSPMLDGFSCEGNREYHPTASFFQAAHQPRKCGCVGVSRASARHNRYRFSLSACYRLALLAGDTLQEPAIGMLVRAGFAWYVEYVQQAASGSLAIW